MWCIVLLLWALVHPAHAALQLQGSNPTPFARYTLENSYIDTYNNTRSIGSFYQFTGTAAESVAGYGLTINWPRLAFGQYTVALKFKATKVNTTVPLLSSSNGMSLLLTSSRQLQYVTPDQQVVSVSSSPLFLGFTYQVIIALDQVTHAACVYYYEYTQGGGLTNSVLMPVSVCSPTLSHQTLRDINVGFKQQQTYLWDVMVWNVTLNPSQVQNIYSDLTQYIQAPITGPAPTPAPTGAPATTSTATVTLPPTLPPAPAPAVGCTPQCVNCSNRNTSVVCTSCVGNYALPGCVACATGFSGSTCQYYSEPLIYPQYVISRIKFFDNLTDDYGYASVTGSASYVRLPFTGFPNIPALNKSSVVIQFPGNTTADFSFSFWFWYQQDGTVLSPAPGNTGTPITVTVSNSNLNLNIGGIGWSALGNPQVGNVYRYWIRMNQCPTCVAGQPNTQKLQVWEEGYTSNGLFIASQLRAIINVPGNPATPSSFVTGPFVLWDLVFYSVPTYDAAFYANPATEYSSISYKTANPCATAPSACTGCSRTGVTAYSCSACAANYNITTGCSQCNAGWGGTSCQTILYLTSSTNASYVQPTEPVYVPPVGFQARCNPVIPGITQYSVATQPIYAHYNVTYGCTTCLPGFAGQYCHQCLQNSPLCPWTGYYGYSNLTQPTVVGTIINYKPLVNITCPTILPLPSAAPIEVFYDPATNCMECLVGFTGPYCTDNAYTSDYRQALLALTPLRKSSTTVTTASATSCPGNYNPTTNCLACLPGYTGLQCQTPLNNTNLITPVYANSLNPVYIGVNLTTNVTLYPPQNLSCTFGKTGYACSVYNVGFSPQNVVLPSPCLNGGTVNVSDPLRLSCICPPGYVDSNCAEVFNPCVQSAGTNPCHNGGVCSFVSNKVQCICPLNEYTGPLCDTPINFCNVTQTQVTKCVNSQTCTYLGPGQYRCTCLPGWRGSNCDIPINMCTDNPFLCKAYDSGATCTNTGPGTYTCKCTTGGAWYGTNCTQPNNPCSPTSPFPNPCLNGATCTHGTAAGSYSCNCTTGFTGTNCGTTIDFCSAFDLNNPYRLLPGGTACGGNAATRDHVYPATDWKCYSSKSSPIVLGDYLCCSANPLAAPAYRNGVFGCPCPNGYTGKNCDQLVNYCNSPLNPPLLNPCSVNGTNTKASGTVNGCQNDYANLNYTCACQPWWTGQSCNTFIKYCGLNFTGTAPYICPGNQLGFTCTCNAGETCNSYPGGVSCCNDNGCVNKPLYNQVVT